MISRILPLALLLALWPGSAWPQDVLTIQELELQYSSKVRQHQAAFDAWTAMEIRLGRALDSVTAATDSGNADRRNRAFTVFRQLAGEIRVQERRVDEIAEELRAARSDLLTALGQRLEELTQQADSAVDPQERRELAAILYDRNSRFLELRAEEDPETKLEPMQDITIDPRDTPDLIIRKAELLDFRANQYEAQLTEVGRRLEELRRDQRRARQVRDFVAGVERYDDTRLPVVSPGARAVDPPDPRQLPPGADTLGVEARPLTLEERIQNLDLLQQELGIRLQQIRDKAERYRRLARGGTEG